MSNAPGRAPWGVARGLGHMGDGRFQKGFDPRRSPGGKPGPRQQREAEIERNRAPGRVAPERPRLTRDGPKDSDKVQ